MENICIIIAMTGEARALIQHFGLKERKGLFDSFLPLKIYQGVYKEKNLHLIINGKDDRFDIDNIGTQPATLAAYLAIHHIHPDIIINTGTAGGFKDKGLEIGDVVLAHGKAWFHDRRIPIPKFDEYGLGAFPLNNFTKIAKDLGFKTGTISTGNAFDFIEKDQEIMEKFGASIKDMEAASIAWLCYLSNTPLIILKGVTDFVGLDQEGEEQFVANFKLTINKLTKANIALVDYLLQN